MRWIVGSSLRYRFLIVAGAAALLLFGVGRVRDMPVDVFPEFAPPRVEIQTVCLGLSATEVETLVTVPLEQALTGVEGLQVMRSKSVPDLSSIVLIFAQDADLLRARQLVQERIAAITNTLPTWAAPPYMMPPLSATSRCMKIGLSSKSMSLMQMSMVAYWTIRERLLRVPGVANVAIWGERLQMLQVQVAPARMHERDVSLNDVMTATADALDAGLLQYSSGAMIGTGGFVETPNQRIAIRHTLPIVTAADLADVSLAARNGAHVRLADVAQVVEDHQPLIGDAVINDGPGILLIVEKFPWANTLTVTHGVEAALDALRPGLTDITVDAGIFRPASFIEMAIHNLAMTLLIGCVLVVAVLGAFLYDWRTAVISTVAIPLSLMAAALVLSWRGTTINTMVLAGFVIATGVVVDDAIIDVENIVRRLRQRRAQGSSLSTARIILDASLEVRGAIIYATMIDVVTLVPVVFMQGLSGSFFRPLAISYGLAVMASMLVALTVTPALSLILLRGTETRHGGSPLLPWAQQVYASLLQRIMARPHWAYGAVSVVVLIGISLLPGLGQSLLPSFKERDFLMHWVTTPGTSHPEMARITTQVSRELRAVPGVRNFGAHIGQAFLADEVVGVDFGENWISVDPSVDYDATVAAVQSVVDGYPGLYHDVQTYLKERIREVLTGAHAAVVVRIFGPDLTVLRSTAQTVRNALNGIDGVADLHQELEVDVPQVQVQVNLDAAHRYGIKPGDVRRVAGILMAGEEVGDIYRGGKCYDVQVWSTPETRHSLTSIRDLPIDVPGGGYVRLGDVASVRMAPAPNAIKREGASRRIDVSANVRGRDLGSVAGEIKERLARIAFPLGYHAEVLGEYAEREAAERHLLAFAGAALIGVLVLLQASFGNTRLALLSFLTLPSALVGGILAAQLSGGIISLGSLVGFFTVFGIAARNGIMLINHYQHLETAEAEPFAPALIIRGAVERLSPILMTALATGLALVPLVIAGDIPGHEIEHPMAVVILGGLITSSLLNLFVVPSLYFRFGQRPTLHKRGV